MSERDILIDCLRYRPVATTAAQMREASDLLERDGARIAELEAENERLLEANPSAAYALEYASLRIGLNSARAALAEAQEELRVCQQDAIRLQSALAEARESVAQWMIAQGFATGHGDTIKDLLGEITWQVREIKERAAEAQKDAIRYLWLRQSTLRTSGLPAICIISFDGYHIRIAHDEADKYIDAAIAKEQSHASE